MATFFPDEACNVDFEANDVDFGEPRPKRDQVACFLHLCDLVYMHPQAASASAIAFVKKLEAAVTAEKAAREKRLVDVREREARRRETDRQKATAEKRKTEQATADDTHRRKGAVMNSYANRNPRPMRAGGFSL